jgi:hypothetical protein
MKFKIDENPPAEVARDLESLGHEAHTVVDESLQGAPDSVIIRASFLEGRVLLTLDKGITRAVPSLGELHHGGIVLFRPSSWGRGLVLSFVRRHLPLVLDLPLLGQVCVVTDKGIRSRRTR